MDIQENFSDHNEFGGDGGEEIGDLSIMGDFFNEWEEAQGPEYQDAILEFHCAMYPRLEGDFRGLVETRCDLDRAIFGVGRGVQGPKRLGPYRILRLLARGGMGEVYEAEDETLSRRVAVKTIRVGGAANRRLIEQFKAERGALALLHNTNIVPIHAAGEEDGLLYFAMPLIEGFTLDDLVEAMKAEGASGPGARSTPAPPPTWADLIGRAQQVGADRRAIQRLSSRFGVRAARVSSAPPCPDPDPQSLGVPPIPRPAGYDRRMVEIVAVAAEAIHGAHEAGVLHLDLKPSNILVEFLSKSDPTLLHPWVIDFGLVDAVESADGRGPSGSTGRFQMRGTKGFMAPEMIVIHEAEPGGALSGPEGRPPITRATDVWSLGITLYQLLTLRLPFSGDQPTIDRETATPPCRHGPALPAELQAVLLKALQKRPEHRYATAAEFAEDLRLWLGDFPTVAGKASYGKQLALWTRRRPARAIAAGMTAAFLFVSGLVAWQSFETIHAKADTARAETVAAKAEASAARHMAATARAEAAMAQAEARSAQQVARANRRELDLIALTNLRAPIRVGGWFEDAWARTRDFTAGRPAEEGRSQGLFAAVLEGLDVRLAKSFGKSADMLAFDPDGKRLLMGQGGQGPLGRPLTRLVMGDLAGQQGPTEVNYGSHGVMGFRRDGAALFLELDSGDPSLLHLRDAITGKQIRLLKSPRDGASAIVALALSGDGSLAAGVVWPLRRRTPGEMAGFADGEDKMTPDGDTATLVVWELETGRVVRSVGEKQAPTHDIALSPDGSLMATWDPHGRHREVAVWAVGDGRLVGRYPAAQSAIASIAFGRDPTWREGAKSSSWRLAVGERGGRITVWDLGVHAVKSIARGSNHDVKTLDFSPDGSILASTGRDLLMIWDVASGQCLLTAPTGNTQLAVAFSPDGRRVAVARSAAFGYSEGVNVYDLDGGRGMRTLRGLSERIVKVALSGDGRRVAALSNDWEVGLFDKLSGELIGVVEAPEGSFIDNAALSLSADGKRLVCSAGTSTKLWDVEGKRLLREWEFPPGLTEAAGFRPDGHLFLVRQETRGRKDPPFGGVDPKVHPRVCRAYELPEQGESKMVAEITESDWYVEHIALTPDAAYFAIQGIGTATGKAARILHLYDGSSGGMVGAIPTSVPPNAMATGMRFDPKGTRLHVGTDPGDIDRHEIFEVPSLKPAGAASGLHGVNVGVSRWLTVKPRTADSSGMIVLRERDRPAPLLRIVRDVEVAGLDGILFSVDDNDLVWGNLDGTVTVCDLNKVQERLAGVGLGWQ